MIQFFCPWARFCSGLIRLGECYTEKLPSFLWFNLDFSKFWFSPVFVWFNIELGHHCLLTFALRNFIQYFQNVFCFFFFPFFSQISFPLVKAIYVSFPAGGSGGAWSYSTHSSIRWRCCRCAVSIKAMHSIYLKFKMITLNKLFCKPNGKGYQTRKPERSRRLALW